MHSYLKDAILFGILNKIWPITVYMYIVFKVIKTSQNLEIILLVLLIAGGCQKSNSMKGNVINYSALSTGLKKNPKIILSP